MDTQTPRDTSSNAVRSDVETSRQATHTAASTPRWLRRALLVAGGVCAFALVGSLINPDWSRAGGVDGARAVRVHGGGSGATGPGAARAMPIVEADGLIGTLECREYRILIHHADPMPLYTVCTPDGRVLRENLQADDVYREFPTVDLKRLHLEPSSRDAGQGPLMLVYPLD
jgi:hypothetical protein